MNLLTRLSIKMVFNIFSLVESKENIEINGSEIETLRVVCDELELTLNLSEKDNFQPVKIHKVNGKNEFTMILIEFIG